MFSTKMSEASMESSLNKVFFEISMRCTVKILGNVHEVRERYEGVTRGGIFTLIRSPGIDSKESIPPAFVARRAGTTTLFQLGS
jgi:hypothetical protein